MTLPGALPRPPLLFSRACCRLSCARVCYLQLMRSTLWNISLRSAANQPDAESTLEAAEIARICLLGIREGLAEMTSQS